MFIVWCYNDWETNLPNREKVYLHKDGRIWLLDKSKAKRFKSIEDLLRYTEGFGNIEEIRL